MTEEYYQFQKLTPIDTLEWDIAQLQFLRDEPTGIPQIDDLVEFANETDLNAGYHPETLYELDTQIKSDSLGFVRQGICLAQICKRKLFKFRKFKTFKDYCLKSLGKSLSYCWRLIQSAGVVLKLIKLGFDRLPQNEAQCRPLVKLSEEELEGKWQRILGIADCQTNKGVVTAQIVNDVMEAGGGKKAVRLNADLHEKLVRVAHERELSVEQVIEEALQEYYYSPKREEEPAAEDPTEDVSVAAGEDVPVKRVVSVGRVPIAQKIANWQRDLQNLVSEYEQQVSGLPAANSTA